MTFCKFIFLGAKSRLIFTILQNNSKNYSKTNHKLKSINWCIKQMYPGRLLVKYIANVSAVSCVPVLQLPDPVLLLLQQFLYPLQFASLYFKKEMI